MRDNKENPMRDAVWPGGGQPRWPAFVPKTPEATVLVPATFLHDEDTVVISLAGKPPEKVTLGHFATLLRDGKSDGLLHVGMEGSPGMLASFASIRGFLMAPPGCVVHSAPRK